MTALLEKKIENYFTNQFEGFEEYINIHSETTNSNEILTLVPTKNISIPLPHSYYESTFKDLDNENYSSAFKLTSKEQENIRTLQEFASSLACETKDIDPEITDLINKNFWDLF